MRNERRTARRANTQDNPDSPSLSLQLPRARITGGNVGSPITPSTPPHGGKRLNNQSQSQNMGGFTSVNFGNAIPSTFTPVTANGRRTTKTTHTSHNDDDDTMMNNRMSLDSTTSTVTNSTITGDDHIEATVRHVWTDDQIAVIVRVSSFYIFMIFMMLINCSDSRRRRNTPKRSHQERLESHYPTQPKH